MRDSGRNDKGSSRAGVLAVCAAMAAVSLSVDVTAQARETVRTVPRARTVVDADASGALRAALSDTDMVRVFDRLTGLDLSRRPDAIRAAKCVASGDCSTRYTPVAASVAPAALARALSRDSAVRHRLELEAESLLEAFRLRRREPHGDVVDAVTFLMAAATTAYAGAPSPAEQRAFRRSLQRALSMNGAFHVTSDRERQVAAELCEILGMHLLRESARHVSAPQPEMDAVRRYAAQVIYAAFKVRLAELDWSQFTVDVKR